MPSTPRSPAPAWTRRVQGWSFLLFFLSLIVLTFLAVMFYNANEFSMSGYFAGLASVVPLLLVIVVYYARPVWGINVPLAPAQVADALASATRGRAVEPVSAREGPFARCVAVVRFAEPACMVGWSPAPTAAGPARDSSVVVLRPEGRNGRAVAALRETLAASLRAAGQAAA